MTSALILLGALSILVALGAAAGWLLFGGDR